MCLSEASPLTLHHGDWLQSGCSFRHSVFSPSLRDNVVKLWFVYMHVSAAIFMAFSAAGACHEGFRSETCLLPGQSMSSRYAGLVFCNASPKTALLLCQMLRQGGVSIAADLWFWHHSLEGLSRLWQLQVHTVLPTQSLRSTAQSQSGYLQPQVAADSQ